MQMSFPRGACGIKGANASRWRRALPSAPIFMVQLDLADIAPQWCRKAKILSNQMTKVTDTNQMLRSGNLMHGKKVIWDPNAPQASSFEMCQALTGVVCGGFGPFFTLEHSGNDLIQTETAAWHTWAHRQHSPGLLRAATQAGAGGFSDVRRHVSGDSLQHGGPGEQVHAWTIADRAESQSPRWETVSSGATWCRVLGQRRAKTARCREQVGLLLSLRAFLCHLPSVIVVTCES